MKALVINYSLQSSHDLVRHNYLEDDSSKWQFVLSQQIIDVDTHNYLLPRIKTKITEGHFGLNPII